MPDSSDPAAILAGIRERNTTASTYDTWHLVGRDVSRLLKAVEAVLKLTDEWETSQARTSQAAVQRQDARALREAITRELTGQEASDGG